MQRAAIVSGVLGLGAVLVFAAAGLAAVLFPSGGTVPGWNTWGGGFVGRAPAPLPMPAIEPGVIIDDGKDRFIELPVPVEDQ